MRIAGDVSPLRAMRLRVLAFLAVIGPGFITANVDNDPGGILTYSQAGAKFGYALLWTLIPTTVALIVVQEMAARMGAVTGKGLSELIREEFGLRSTFFTMIVLGLADLGNIAAEFAGVASAVGIFGISKYVAVPLAAFLVWGVVVRGTYVVIERLLLLFSLVYFAYPVSAWLSHPDWRMAVTHTFLPDVNDSSEYLMIIGLVGDDDHAVDAVLSAGVHRGEGYRHAPILAESMGCHHRLHHHRRRRILHRRRLRSDAVHAGRSRNQGCR